MGAELEFEQLFARMVAIDTTSCNSNLALIEVLADYLQRDNIECQIDTNQQGKANLYASTPSQSDHQGQGLTLCGHSDTVPAGEPDWASDPFRLSDDGGRWVARGSADMKGFLALASERLVDWSQKPLRAPLALLVTFDEEVGSHGAERFVTQGSAPRSVLIGEPTELKIHRLHKGHLRLTLTVNGTAGHSAYPERGVNSITAAAKVITAMEQLARTLRQESSPLGDLFGEVPYTVLHVATVSGGSAVNVIPEQCTIQLGLRLLPGADPNKLTERLRQTAREATSCDVLLERGRYSPPMATEDDAPLIAALKRASGETVANGVHFSSDGGFLSAAGYECALFGPGSIQVAHQANEYLPKRDVIRAREILDAVIHDLCVAQPAEQRS